jgi:hypothetical protein
MLDPYVTSQDIQTSISPRSALLHQNPNRYAILGLNSSPLADSLACRSGTVVSYRARASQGELTLTSRQVAVT